jgi:uncharacterized protein (TIGR00251 family)
MSASFLRETTDGVVLSAKVQPRASRNHIQGVHGNELKVSVTAPPVDAAANDALIRFLADELGCSRGSIQLLRGQTSRHKTILIKGLASAHILRKLGMT